MGCQEKAPLLIYIRGKLLRNPIKKFLIKLIIEDAILFEERSYNYYESLLERAAMKESIVLLKKLLAGELSHRLRLEEIQKRGELGTLQVHDGTELEGYEEVSKRFPQLEPWSSKEEIIEVALKKEKSSHNFYRAISMKAHIKTVARLFGALAMEELEHVKWIENEMSGNK
jgi:rubrerythrin